MHPEALPPFCLDKKHWRMSTMTFLDHPAQQGDPEWLDSQFTCKCFLFFFLPGSGFLLQWDSQQHDSYWAKPATVEYLYRAPESWTDQVHGLKYQSSAESLAMTASQYLAILCGNLGFCFSLKFFEVCKDFPTRIWCRGKWEQPSWLQKDFHKPYL